jgi:hypothetical protein
LNERLKAMGARPIETRASAPQASAPRASGVQRARAVTSASKKKK